MKNYIHSTYILLNNNNLKSSIIKCASLLLLLLISIWLPFFSYIAFSFFIIFLMFEHSESSLYLFFFLLPFQTIFTAEYGSVFNLYRGAVILWAGILCLKYLINIVGKKESLPNKYIIISILAFSIYLFIPINSPLSIVKSFGVLAYLAVLYFVTFGNADFKKASFFLVAGLVLSVALTPLIFTSPRLSDYFYFYKNDSLRFNALTGNPNKLYIISTIAICSIILLYLKKQIDHAVFLALYFPLFALAYSAVSRTFIITFILLFIAFIAAVVFQGIKRNNLKQSSVFLLLFITITIVVCVIMFKHTGEYFNRFFNNSQLLNLQPKTFISHFIGSTNSSIIDDPGRLGIWRRLIKDWLSSPSKTLFGRGLGATYIGNINPHNTYLAILTDFGIIGALLYLNALASILLTKLNFRLKNLNVYVLIFFTLSFAFIFFNEALYRDEFGLFAFIILFTNLQKDKLIPIKDTHDEDKKSVHIS